MVNYHQYIFDVFFYSTRLKSKFWKKNICSEFFLLALWKFYKRSFVDLNITHPLILDLLGRYGGRDNQVYLTISLKNTERWVWMFIFLFGKDWLSAAKKNEVYILVTGVFSKSLLPPKISMLDRFFCFFPRSEDTYWQYDANTVPTK